MLDSKANRLENSLGSFTPIAPIEAFAAEPENVISFSDDDFLICRPFCPGFLLEFKRWCLFDVSKIRDVDFNDNAFRDLVLPQDKKDLISALVKQQKHEDLDFDDLIKGKGKGLVVLLHGPPGDALVLLDEADVFMQQRGIHDLARNSMVSILLRVLEYFEGIMFLTTNRVQTIDDAFQSRIHLSLSYPKLDAAARLQLWISGLVRACRNQQPSWATEEALRELADAKVNGRNIKNIIRLGCGLARDSERELEKSDILKGLRALEGFEADFKRLSEEES
ncbi:hypothetical protein E8E14_006806 [Neopestalotiopsis sp. 37M]|nr:hypothetical protein E8E14_006806 [Neopestalotiopsis sp. 37M]